MFEKFTALDIETTGARIHLRHGGKGPPLLLLHGNPMTHVTWHKIADRLAERFHVVATDLRGYGDSVGPEDGGENHENYSFRAMAQDQIEVMGRLGYRDFFAAGHDRGARTVHRMALDHPERVKRCAVIDIVFELSCLDPRFQAVGDEVMALAVHGQPCDLPERVMASVPADSLMERKLSKPGIGIGFFAPEAFSEYVRCFNWKTIRGSCEDSASLPETSKWMKPIEKPKGKCPVPCW